eukprot:3402556-Rhodomonas_salina.1
MEYLVLGCAIPVLPLPYVCTCKRYTITDLRCAPTRYSLLIFAMPLCYAPTDSRQSPTLYIPADIL